MAAAKRNWDEEPSDSGNPDYQSAAGDKRIKRRRPSLQKVVEQAIQAKRLRSIVSALEPLFRRVVQEEVERLVIIHSSLLCPQRSFEMRTAAAVAVDQQASSSLKLIFRRQPSLPIFTVTKIEDVDHNPLQLLLAGTSNVESPRFSGHNLPESLKVELVVLEGDFHAEDDESANWTSEEFQGKIVKEREGKRPLLVGEVCVTLREGAALIPDLSFTDNSHWGKSGMFRIGARVVPGSYDGPRIREAITKPFKVKDYRGQSYKKHYPPALKDQVWRLEKISKGGKFHKKLASENINTVQDFLKLLFIDQYRLRKILGAGMSDRTWEVTTNHARTCVVGEKLYLHRGQLFSIVINSVCQIVGVVRAVEGPDTLVKPQDLMECRDYVQQLAREAYDNWDYLGDYHGSISMPDASMPPQFQNEEKEVGAAGEFAFEFGGDCFGQPF